MPREKVNKENEINEKNKTVNFLFPSLSDMICVKIFLID